MKSLLENIASFLLNLLIHYLELFFKLTLAAQAWLFVFKLKTSNRV